MSAKIFIPTFVLGLSLLLTACGDGIDVDFRGGENEKPSPEAKEVPRVNHWEDAGDGALPEDGDSVTDTMRSLVFVDGIIIRYDGSGREEVICRGGSDSEGHYEVCVSLDDDPHYITLETNFLVWHPLMFTRFGNYLQCWTWRGNEAKMEADCEDVFARMGGAGFRCWPGLEGGDKALRCTDGWSVTANGEDGELKTVCRVHTESGTGRCLSAPREGVEDATLILPMQMTSWDGYTGSHDNEKQFMAGEMAMALVPQDVPEDAQLEYVSSDESICTVDEEGSISIDASVVAPAQCQIYLRVRAEGYADRILFVDVPVLKESDARWANYVPPENQFFPGESLGAESVVSLDPSTTENEFVSLTTDVCSVDENGTLLALKAGECMVKLTARAEGYLDVIVHNSVTVVALSSLVGTIVWSDFPTSAVVGTPTARLGDPSFVGGDANPVAGVSLSVKHATGSCAWDDNRKIITFTEINECVLEVTAIGERGYEKKSTLFRVTTGLGTFTLTWNGYIGGNRVTYGPTVLALDAPSIVPSLAGVTYAYSFTGDACEVDADSGALTILAAGTCEVTVTASVEGRRDQSFRHRVTVEKKAAADRMENPYQGVASLANGDNLAVVNPPSGGVGTLSYGKNTGNCTVNAEGVVTASASSGTCVVDVAYSGDENHSISTFSFSITMVGSRTVAPVWASNPYSGSLVAGGTAVNPNPFTNASSGVGVAHYRSSTPNICTVNLTSGALRGVSIGDCQVDARFGGDSTTGASAWVSSSAITVGKGTPSTTTFASREVWGTSPTVKVGQILAIENPLDGYGVPTFTVKSGSETYCEVDGTTGAVTGRAPGSCTVQATLEEGDDYTALTTATDVSTITVTLGDQTITFGNIYGTNIPTISGIKLRVIEAPVASEGAVTYRVNPTSAENCRVKPDGSVLLAAPGECVVQVRGDATARYAATDWINGATLQVTGGTFLGLSWDPSTIGRIGEELELDGVNLGGIRGTVLYSVIDAGDSGCSFKGRDGVDARTLVFTAPGICQVEARAVREHFEDWFQEASIQVRAGVIAVTVNSFGSGRVLKVGVNTPVAPSAYTGLNPADASARWTLLRGENDCVLVNPITGAVRARAVEIDPSNPPNCSIQLTARKDNYRLYRSEPIHIPLEEGELGSLTAPVYSTGATLRLDGHADLVRAPRDPHGVEVTVTGFVVRGSLGTRVPCRVDNNPSSATYGRVTSGSSGIGEADLGYICTVEVTVGATGYEPKTASVALVLGEDLTFSTPPRITWVNARDTSTICAFTAGVANTCRPRTPPPTTDESAVPVDISVRHQAHGGDADGNPKEGVCSISRATLSRGSAALGGDICIVSTVLSAVGYVPLVTAAVEILVAKGTLAFTSATKPSYTGDLRPGGSLTLSGAHFVDDNSVAVQWGRYRVSESSCTIDQSTGEITAKNSARAGDTCTVFATATAPGYENSREVQIQSITLLGTGTFGTLTGPVYWEDLTVGGNTISIGTLPQVTPDLTDREIVWSYAATGKRSGLVTADICSVDQTGAVGPGSAAQIGDTCEIVATASSTGYGNKAASATVLTVKEVFNSLNWSAFPDEAVVGININLSGASKRPISEPVADSYTETYLSGDCAYSNAKVLSFSDSTPCVVRVTATKTGFANLTAVFTVTPQKGTITVASDNWGSYPSVAYRGSGVVAPGISTTPSDVTKTYTSLTHQACSVDAAGVVESVDDTRCRVRLRLSKKGYQTLEHIYAFFIDLGVITLAGIDEAAKWGTYSGVVYGGDTVNAPVITPTPSGAQKVYQSLTTGVCTVNDAGAVTPLDDGNCRIRLTLSATHYSGLEYIYDFTVAPGTIGVAGSNDAAKWGSYAAVTVGGGEVDAPATGTLDPSDVTKTYSSLTSGVCSVDSDGAVTGVTNGACEIKLVLAKENYTDIEYTYSFTVGLGTQSVTWGSFSGNLVVGGARKAPSAAGNLNGATVSYALKTGSAANCDLRNAGTGEVEAKAVDVSTTKTCTIIGTATRTGYTNAVSGDISIDLEAGTISGVTWTPGASTGTVGTDLVLNAVSGATVENVSYVISRAGTTGCDWVGSSGAAQRTLRFTNTGTCTVSAHAVRPGYGDMEFPPSCHQCGGRNPERDVG